MNGGDVETGTKVRVLGVWGRDRVFCDDQACPREHYTRRGIGDRYHYEDHERDGRPGTVTGTEARDRVVVEMEDGNTLAVDASDVEEVQS